MGKKSRNRPGLRNDARSEPEFEYRSYIEASLTACKRRCDAGLESAFWDAVLLCEQTNTKKPPWLREALEKYARDRINGRAPWKKQMGRPPQPQLDVYIFLCVEEWREQRINFGQKNKTRRFSCDMAYKKVKEELAEDGLNLEPDAIRAAYRRGKKIWSEPDAYVSPFLEEMPSKHRQK